MTADNDPQKLKDIMDFSDLSPDKKEELFSIFGAANSEEMAAIIELLAEEPSLLPKFSQNLEEKKKAAADKNVGAWERVVEKEVSELI